MLIFTAITQQILLRIEGSYFILPNNDLYHFVLQLFFASNRGFERGNSFDGSVWSVSIEVLMYGLFFIICLTRFRQWWVPLVFIVAGYLLIHYGVKPVLLVGLGMMYFFLGGLAFHFFSYLRRRYSRRMLYVFVALTALLWVYAPFAQTGSWHLQLEGRFVEVRSLSYCGTFISSYNYHTCLVRIGHGSLGTTAGVSGRPQLLVLSHSLSPTDGFCRDGILLRSADYGLLFAWDVSAFLRGSDCVEFR